MPLVGAILLLAGTASLPITGAAFTDSSQSTSQHIRRRLMGSRGCDRGLGAQRVEHSLHGSLGRCCVRNRAGDRQHRPDLERLESGLCRGLERELVGQRRRVGPRGTGNDRTDVYVAYEQQNGRALVMYGKGADDVYYRVWDAGWGRHHVDRAGLNTVAIDSRAGPRGAFQDVAVPS